MGNIRIRYNRVIRSKKSDKMKIFEQDGKIRLQLMEMKKGIMLFDFTVEKEEYEELSNHMIEHLLMFKVE